GARLTAIWLLALAFAGTVEHVSRLIPELQNALGAGGRVRRLSEAPQEPAGGQTPPEADITVRGLTFRYTPERPPALNEVSLGFRRGRSYAVIGRTGSGKSTLAKVLTLSVE